MSSSQMWHSRCEPLRFPFWNPVIMSVKAVSENDPSVGGVHRVDQSPATAARECQHLATIDSERFLRQCMGNVRLATSLMDNFTESSQSRLAAFDVALRENRNDVISHEAHSLKGVAGILAAAKLADVCVDLQRAAEEGDWNCIRNLIETLHHEMQRAIDCIPHIRAMPPWKSVH